MRTKLKASRLEKGQGMLEFAVGMVVLVILLAGVVDLGRALFTFIALRDSVQEGALYGSTNPQDTAGIKNRVLNASSLVNDYLTNGDVTVQILDQPCAGNGIRVSALLNDFPLTMPFVGMFLGRQTISLNASVTDTILTPYTCP